MVSDSLRTGEPVNHGYVADYQFKDIDNDGEKEIVLAVVLSTGPSLTGRSVVAVYKMKSEPATEPVKQP